MRIIKWGIIFLLCFTLFFNFMPTGSSNQEVVDGFFATQSYAQNSSTMLSNYSFLESAVDVGASRYTGDLRQRVCSFAVDVALNLGNGYIPNGGDKSHSEVVGKGIRYRTGRSGAECTWAGCPSASASDDTWFNGQFGYGSKDIAINNLKAVANGTLSHMHLSCHGSCTLMWSYMWADAPYWCGGVNTIHAGEMISVNNVSDVRSVAKPGDLIQNGDPTDTSMDHSCMWLGDIIFTDLAGNTVEIHDAVMNCGWVNSTNDFVIKEWYQESSKTYYVWPLECALKEAYGDAAAEPVLTDWADEPLFTHSANVQLKGT